MTTLKIIYRPINELKRHKNNARTHPQSQIEQIINSVNEFGWTNPILIDEGDIIIAGHGRLESAEILGLNEVPCIVLSGLTDAQKRAYRIADNQLPLNAGWDIELLQSEIEALKLENFDIDLLGFNSDEFNKTVSTNEINFPDSFSECNETSLNNKCPKCGFEYD